MDGAVVKSLIPVIRRERAGSLRSWLAQSGVGGRGEDGRTDQTSVRCQVRRDTIQHGP